MFNLKSIYFYFLAIQISLIKFIKKIYFSTNYYNKSLISKAPQQFYFHPNPFLLSSITNYKKYSFKISEIDPNLFWVDKKKTWEEKEIHNLQKESFCVQTYHLNTHYTLYISFALIHL